IFMRDFGSAFGFEDLFGARASGRGRRARRKGQDLKVVLSLTLAEVVTGARKALRIEVLENCAECGGTGSEGGAPPVRCGTCGGSGEVRRVQRTFVGQMVSVTPCPNCGGEGERIERFCPACDG